MAHQIKRYRNRKINIIVRYANQTTVFWTHKAIVYTGILHEVMPPGDVFLSQGSHAQWKTAASARNCAIVPINNVERPSTECLVQWSTQQQRCLTGHPPIIDRFRIQDLQPNFTLRKAIEIKLIAYPVRCFVFVNPADDSEFTLSAQNVP